MDDFYIGQMVDWLHGDHHRIAEIKKIKDDRILLEGMVNTYWIKKETLIKKINKPYPVARSQF